MTRLFIGAGRDMGVRPGDIVGAIANEAGIASKRIGAIEICERFSLVEVDTPVANAVIEAMRETTIKGKNVTVRRDRPKKAASDSERRSFEPHGHADARFEEDGKKRRGKDGNDKKPKRDKKSDKSRGSSRFYE